MQDCWRENPDDRPTFENLRDELKEMESQHQVTCEHSFSLLKISDSFFSGNSLVDDTSTDSTTLVLKPRPNDRKMSTQHLPALLGATCCERLATVLRCERTTPNMSQHIATRCPNAHNMLRPTMLRYVMLTCCDRLAAGLIGHTQCKSTSLSKFAVVSLS